MRTKRKGHKCDRVSADKRANTAGLMKKMPQMLLDYKRHTRKLSYPVKKIEKVFPRPVIGIALPTDYFQCDHAKAVDVCFICQVTLHCILGSHVSPGKAILISTIYQWPRAKKFYKRLLGELLKAG